MSYATLFAQLGAEFKNMRKIEALLEQFRDDDNSNYSSRLIRAAYDATVNLEANAITLDTALYEGTIFPSLAAVHSAERGGFETAWFPVVDAFLALDNDEKAKGAISYDYDPTLAASGQIAILKRRGRFGRLYDQMVADSQTIKKNAVSFGSFVAGPNNKGTLVVAGSPTFAGKDHTLSGTINFKCTDDTVDSPRINAQLVLTKPLPDGTTTINADRLATVGKSFEDGPTGLTFELDLSAIVKTGDAGSPIFANPVFTKPSEGDTNKGQLFIKVTRQAVAPIWLIEWFKDSDTSDPTNLVQRSTADGTSGTDTAKQMTRTSTFTFDFNKTNAHADMPAAGNTRTVTFDIKTPRVGDVWTKTVTNDEAGNFASKLARRYRASLNSVGGGGETISDTGAASVSMS